MKYIQANQQIDEYITKYPATRTTFVTLSRRARKGKNYANYLIGEPLQLDNAIYTHLTQQVSAYLRICNQLCEQYVSNKQFKLLIRKMILQFEDEHIANLVETYPTVSMTGVRFGTDIMINQNGDYITTEVNLGPAGGPAEAICIEKKYKNTKFSISPDTYLQYFIYALNAYYIKACRASGNPPKNLLNRHLVVLENDEWTPGNFIYFNLLRKAGLKVSIAAREALTYNHKKNVLTLKVNEKDETVDQLIIYFHIQDDFLDDSNKIPGNLIQALQSHAVYLDTNFFPLIVLASKSMAGFISQMARNENHPWIKKLKLNKQDLQLVKDMFPITYHWDPNLIKKIYSGKINRFNLIELLSSKKIIIKSSKTRFFAGEGVFGTDNKKGRKNYQDFSILLMKDVIKNLMLKDNIGCLTKIMELEFLNQCLVFLQKQYQVRVNKLPLKSKKELLDNLNKIYQHFKSETPTEENINKFIHDVASIILHFALSDINSPSTQPLIHGITNYIASYMYLPYVLQKKILSETPYELRVSGFIGDKIDNHACIISTLKPLTNISKNRPLHVYIPKDYKALSKNKENNKSLSNTPWRYINKNSSNVVNINQEFILLTQKEKVDLLKDIYSQLEENSQIELGIPDLTLVKKNLLNKNNVLVKKVVRNDKVHQNLQIYQLLKVDSNSITYTINESIIEDHIYESFQEKIKVYLPTHEYLVQNLKAIGFNNVQVKKLEDDDCLDYSDIRVVITARK